VERLPGLWRDQVPRRAAGVRGGPTVSWGEVERPGAGLGPYPDRRRWRADDLDKGHRTQVWLATSDEPAATFQESISFTRSFGIRIRDEGCRSAEASARPVSQGFRYRPSQNFSLFLDPDDTRIATDRFAPETVFQRRSHCGNDRIRACDPCEEPDTLRCAVSMARPQILADSVQSSHR
jgi:hypothetical protein